MMKRGFTLPEMLISLFIIGIVGVAASQFIRNIFIFNQGIQDSLTAQLEGRKLIKIMTAELRTAVPSAIGSYAIDTAASSTVIFYADINNDGKVDRVRYFLNNATRTLTKGVVVPTGSPASYDLTTEKLSTLITSIANGTSTNLFDYYDDNYAGTTTPLAFPINIASIHLVKVTAFIDKDPNRSPNTITLTSQVVLRNLKDNI